MGDKEPEKQLPGVQPRRVGWLLRIFAGSRFFAVLAVIGTLVSAVTLYVYGTLLVGTIVLDTVTGRDISVDGAKKLQIAFVTLTDVFLLGTVLVIVAFGLYQLFIQPDLPVPDWLKIRNLDQLNQQLIEVVGVLLAVTFLAFAVEVAGDRASVLEFGVAVAVVIGALSLLLVVSHRLHRSNEPPAAE